MPYADPIKAREKHREYAKKYYWANRERQVARAAKWNQDNKGRVLENQRLWRRGSSIAKVLFRNAQQRARKHGIEFAITVDDIDVPECCPVLGLRFAIGDGSAKDFSPSVDRVDPRLGYVRGNIRVISHKANTIKSNATVDELRKVMAYAEGRL